MKNKVFNQHKFQSQYRYKHEHKQKLDVLANSDSRSTYNDLKKCRQNIVTIFVIKCHADKYA